MANLENRDIKRFSPGSYNFKHQELGDVTLTFEETPEQHMKHVIRVLGNIRVVDHEGKAQDRITVMRSAYGINFDNAFSTFMEKNGNVMEAFIAGQEMPEGEVVDVKAPRKRRQKSARAIATSLRLAGT